MSMPQITNSSPSPSPRPVAPGIVTDTIWRSEWPSLDWLGASKDRSGAVGYAIVAGEGDGRRILYSAKTQAALPTLDEVRGSWERSECVYARVLL
jgi:hypothetical protein